MDKSEVTLPFDLPLDIVTKILCVSELSIDSYLAFRKLGVIPKKIKISSDLKYKLDHINIKRHSYWLNHIRYTRGVLWYNETFIRFNTHINIRPNGKIKLDIIEVFGQMHIGYNEQPSGLWPGLQAGQHNGDIQISFNVMQRYHIMNNTIRSQICRNFYRMHTGELIHSVYFE